MTGDVSAHNCCSGIFGAR